MADLNNLPGGGRPATIDQINEILRGAVIKQIRREKAIDVDHGGECVQIQLVGGDSLIFIASPNPAGVQILGDPTAFIQPLLVTRSKTKLKT